MQFEWINFKAANCERKPDPGAWTRNLALVMTSLKQSSEIARTPGSHEQLR